MDEQTSDPLDGIDPDSVTAEDVTDEQIEAALNSSLPLPRQHGVLVCKTLAAANSEHVRPFLDELEEIVTEENAAIVMHAIDVYDVLAEDDPSLLEGHLDGLAEAIDTDHVDIQMKGASAFGTLVVEHSELCVPHTPAMIQVIADTEVDRELPDFSDFVDDRVTRQTLQEHEESERQRRMSARRLLVNVVVAVAEQHPESLTDQVDALAALFDDMDPSIVGGAIDAIREIGIVDPEAVAPVEDQLLACLDHHSEAVQARAINAIGHLEIEGAVPELRSLAESTDNEDLREIAEETATFLEA